MAKYYLVYDETLEFDGFGYRVRIWRQTGAGIVVVDQLPGSPPPDVYSTRIANHVASTHLRFSPVKLGWFERSQFEGQERCFGVSFSAIGHKLRPMFSDPVYRKVYWQAIEQSFGLAEKHEQEA